MALVLHGSVAESYPGSTACYALIRLQRGSADQVAAPLLEQLEELGFTVQR